MNKAEQLCMGCMADKSGEGICPECGYDSRSAYDQDYLAPGTVLGSRYIVGALKHRNGERGEYIGFDDNLQRKIWIREYFPYTISHRTEDVRTIMPNAGDGAQYKALMSDYVDVCNEVKRLSVSDPVIPLENIVGENNTVYGIYKHLDVLSLEEYLTTRGGRLPYDEAVEMLTPLFHAVDNMHLRGVIHRGLSPYTIFVSPAGKMYLDGFSLSGTRTAGSELQSELFNGYSAPEQYAAKGWQGTWTDVYALAAIFYRTVSGIVPPKSTTISSGRQLTALGDLVSTVPNHVSEAVDHAMQTVTKDRTQTVGVLTSVIHSDENSPSTAVFDFVPVVSDTPAPSRRNIAVFEEDYGHTEEVNLEDIESQFIFDETPSSTSSSRFERERPARNATPPAYDDYEYDDYDDSEGGGSRVASRAIVIAIVAVMVAIGVLAAVFFSNRIQPTTPTPDPQDIESGLSEPPPTDPGTTPSPVSEEEDNEEEDLEEVEVPEFVGKNVKEITENTAYKEQYTFEVTEVDDQSLGSGEIITQRPVKGSKVEVKKGEKIEVDLVANKERAKLVMPNVVGMTYEDAIEALKRFANQEGIAFNVAAPTNVYAENIPKGVVVRSVPEEGTEFDPSVDVRLHISTGPASQESTPSESSREESSKSPSSSKEESSTPSQNEHGADLSPNKPPGRNG